MLKPAAVMVIALVLVSCSAAVPTDRGSVPSSAAAESISPREGSAMSEFAISMWRGACFGRCPQYKLTVDGGGGVEFVGERAVNALGAHSGKADKIGRAHVCTPSLMRISYAVFCLKKKKPTPQ